MTTGRRDEFGHLGSFFVLDGTSDDGDVYGLSGTGGLEGGFLVETDPVDGVPNSTRDSIGRFEPRNWRLSHLRDPDPLGRNDRRLELQLVVDYDGSAEDGTAPFGQPEFYDPTNRSSRMIDAQGRVALRTSHERIIDSEDGRFAIALTCRSIGMTEATAPELPGDGGAPIGTRAGAPVPVGVNFSSAGTSGGVTRTQDSVSVGGVTWFGQAAVQAAQGALSGAATALDIARAISANQLGQSPPQTRVGQQQSSLSPPPKVPITNAGGSVSPRLAGQGYVWDSGVEEIGLLGTFFSPGDHAGSYFAGGEGTPIGPLPARHDAQFSMGKNITGRIAFVSDDASAIPTGSGKQFKGLMHFDRSLANTNTDVGLETGNWRPVIRVDASIPARQPPPPPPPRLPPPKKPEKPKIVPPRVPTGGTRPATGPVIIPGGDTAERPRGTPVAGGGQEPTDDDTNDDGATGRPRSGGSTTPPEAPRQLAGAGATSGVSEGSDKDPETQPRSACTDTTAGGTGTSPEVFSQASPAVVAPNSLARNFENIGAPGPQKTSGQLTQNPDYPGSVLFGQDIVDLHGHPAVSQGIAGGLSYGGREATLDQGLTFGLPGGGIPGGVVVGDPGDDAGAFPFGLPGDGVPGGVVVEDAPSGGVSGGYGSGRRPGGATTPQWAGDLPGAIPFGLPSPGGLGLPLGPQPEGADRHNPSEAGRQRRRIEQNSRDFDTLDRIAEADEQLAEQAQEAGEAGDTRRGDRIARQRSRLERLAQRGRDRIARRQRRIDRSDERARRRADRRARREARREARESGENEGTGTGTPSDEVRLSQTTLDAIRIRKELNAAGPGATVVDGRVVPATGAGGTADDADEGGDGGGGTTAGGGIDFLPEPFETFRQIQDALGASRATAEAKTGGDLSGVSLGTVGETVIQGAYEVQTGDFPEGGLPVPGLFFGVHNPNEGMLAGFGAWNTANTPVRHLGSPNGPSTVEGWAATMTYAVQSVQRTVMGAFGGPEYLDAALAVVHRNSAGNPPTPHRLGQWTTSYPGDEIALTRGQGAAEFITTLENFGDGNLEANSGGGFEFIREHRGNITRDDRPLILLENARADNPELITADQIATLDRSYALTAGGDTTQSSMAARYLEPAQSGGRLMQVAQVPNLLRNTTPSEEHLYVDDGSGGDNRGMLVANQGLALGSGGDDAPLEIRDGQNLDFFEPLAEGVRHTTETVPDFRMRVLAAAAGMRWLLLDADGLEVASPRITFGEGGLVVDGSLQVNGTLGATGKATFDDLIDPTGLTYTRVAADPGLGTDYTTWVRTTDGRLILSQAGTDKIIAHRDEISGGRLSRTVGIDLTATGDTTLLTVDAGETVIITGITIVTTSRDAGSSPKLGVGTNVAGDNIILSQNFAGLAVGNSFQIVTSGISERAEATEDIILQVDNASSATDLTVQVDLQGFFLAGGSNAIAGAGADTTAVHVIGSDSSSETQQSSGGSGFETLKTIIMPASTLPKDGDVASFRAGGRVLGTAGGSNRSVSFSFGGARFTLIVVAPNASEVRWWLEIELTRTGSSAETVISFGAQGATSLASRGTAAIDLTTAVTCLIEGQDGNSEDDVACDYFTAVANVF